MGDDLLPAGFAPSPAPLDGTLALDMPGSFMRSIKCVCSLLTCSTPWRSALYQASSEHISFQEGPRGHVAVLERCSCARACAVRLLHTLSRSHEGGQKAVSAVKNGKGTEIFYSAADLILSHEWGFHLV